MSGEAPTPAISVIVPARDAEATIGRTLTAIAAQRGIDFELIVVDHASADSTLEIVTELAPEARTATVVGGGPGAVRNAGVGLARAQKLAFCDADCFPASDWLRAGAAALERYDLCQGKVVPDPEAVRGPFDRTITIGAAHGLFEAASLFVDRAWFERVGGFEDWLGLESGKALGEDTAFGWRLRRAGGRTGFEAEAIAAHAIFPRGPLAYIGERRRLRYFPALARRVPELRDGFLYRRIFLNRKSACFDLALVGGGAAALVARRRGLSLAVPLGIAAAAPYVAEVVRLSVPHGRAAPLVAATEVVADVVSAASLITRSIRQRTVLL